MNSSNNNVNAIKGKIQLLYLPTLVVQIIITIIIIIIMISIIIVMIRIRRI
jgi:hypothetical protein